METCQKVNGSLATFVTNEELQFILKIEVDFDDKVCDRRDQCKLVQSLAPCLKHSELFYSVTGTNRVNFQVLGRLPVCDHQSEPFPGGSLGGGVPR